MGEMVERVAKAMAKACYSYLGAVPPSPQQIKMARAALKETADFIEENYGSLHPGAVYIRSEMENKDWEK